MGKYVRRSLAVDLLDGWEGLFSLRQAAQPLVDELTARNIRGHKLDLIGFSTYDRMYEIQWEAMGRVDGGGI